METPPPLCLRGADVLFPKGFSSAPLGIDGGRVSGASGAGREVDLSGYLVLPGMVDLHGDAFERHIAPRSGVGFDRLLGLASVDAEVCAHGVTTAYLAQSFSWEGGKRGVEEAEQVMAACAAYRARADLRVQLRFETHFLDGIARLVAAIRQGLVKYVIFNNHLPDVLRAAEEAPETVVAWASEAGRSVEAHMALVRAAAANGPRVAESLEALARVLDAEGVVYGSHDDPSAQVRAEFAALGAAICEFPTTRDAAEEARRRGNPVLMGAPNVVRGGSQSGNIAAQELIAAGLCDGLVSDYYYPAMACAAFALVDRGVCDLAQAWALVSAGPARVLGLDDRGTLAEGMRADVAVVNPATRRVEATLVAGRVVHLCEGAAERFLAAKMERVKGIEPSS